jgi:hypothetical protein
MREKLAFAHQTGPKNIFTDWIIHMVAMGEFQKRGETSNKEEINDIKLC